MSAGKRVALSECRQHPGCQTLASRTSPNTSYADADRPCTRSRPPSHFAGNIPPGCGSAGRRGREETRKCLASVSCDAPASGRGGCSGHEVRRVGTLIVESNLAPDVERCTQGRAVAGRLDENVRTFVPNVPTFITSQHHRLERNSVRGRPGGNTHRVPDGAAAELQYYILA